MTPYILSMTSPAKCYYTFHYIVDVSMWPMFGNCSISMRKFIINSILLDVVKKNYFFEGWSWFMFNNLGLALGMVLKFYTSMAKVVKINVSKFVGLVLTFVEVTGKKLVVGAFLRSPLLILNKVNVFYVLQIFFMKSLNSLFL